MAYSFWNGSIRFKTVSERRKRTIIEGLLIFLIMRCLKPDNAVEDEEDQIDMSA